MEVTFPTKPFRTHGGAKVPHHKNTAAQESVAMPVPKRVTIAMQQHIGAPCTPLVKKGDPVFLGQKIGDSSAFVSAPIHASVSGTVAEITKVSLPGGQVVDAIAIDSDGQMTPDPAIAPPTVNSIQDLIAAARDSGLVGLGGAGFPTHVKLNIPPDKKVDTLIVNVAECEPYITADNREALENSWDVLSGVYTLKEFLDIERVIIAVENNKPEVIQVLRDIAYNDTRDPENRVRILAIKSQYPQGAEKVLVQTCTGRKIPPGKLPSDVGCLIMNVTSVAFLSRYLKTGMPLVSRRVTIDGSAIAEPKNVIAPIGTKISEIIAFCGGYRAEPKKILMGGPMMGLALTTDDTPLLKQNNGILAFDEHEAHTMEPTACIRCGRCVTGCPMNLVPSMLEKYTAVKDIEALNRYGISTCMECGTCVYNCPAGRPLVQAIRLGKSLVKNAGGKK